MVSKERLSADLCHGLAMPVELSEEPEQMGVLIKAARDRGPCPDTVRGCCTWLWDLASSCHTGSCHWKVVSAILSPCWSEPLVVHPIWRFYFLSLVPTRPPNSGRWTEEVKGNEVQICPFCLIIASSWTWLTKSRKYRLWSVYVEFLKSISITYQSSGVQLYQLWSKL